MSKLFNAYLSRLFKWPVFRIMLVLMLVGGIAGGAVCGKYQSMWNLPYMLAYIFFPHYIGIITGLFNYPLFTNGTVRNQLSVGHKRSHIYIADWIASNIFAVALYIVFAVSFFVTISLFSDSLSSQNNMMSMMNGIPENMMAASTGTVSFEAIVTSLIVSTVQIIFFTTLTQLFCIILKGVKSFLAIYLGNQTVMLAGILLGLISEKVDISEKTMYLFPTNVSMIMSSSFETHPDSVIAVFIMLAETALIFIIGIMYVRKTDFT